MGSRGLGLLTAFLLAASVTGCANRLTGPIHIAENPPWTAADTPAVLPWTADDVLRHRIILIGDTGYYLENDPTLKSLDRWATEFDSTSVIFLGDNIYNEGLTDDDRAHGEHILSHQLASTTASKIFIPGNHDWGFMPKDQNAKAIRNQQAFIEQWPADRAEFIPKDGCMGPVTRILHEAGDQERSVVFIALDPTPWINARLRDACPRAQTDEEFLNRLDAVLTEHAEDFVLLGSHYPMLTGGPHGGLTYGLLADMIVTPLGWMMGGLGNTYEPRYADWIERTQAVLRSHPPEIYAAGHDHSLQLLDAGDVAGLYVVSGAGAVERVSTVTHLPETFFAHAAPGFVVIDIIDSTDNPENSGEENVVIRV
ncbi:MAG: metallophosphoesterase, partial [Myxococcota bacterium]